MNHYIPDPNEPNFGFVCVPHGYGARKGKVYNYIWIAMDGFAKKWNKKFMIFKITFSDENEAQRFGDMFRKYGEDSWNNIV